VADKKALVAKVFDDKVFASKYFSAKRKLRGPKLRSLVLAAGRADEAAASAARMSCGG